MADTETLGIIEYGSWISFDTNIKYRHLIDYNFASKNETTMSLQWRLGLEISVTKGSGNHGGNYSFELKYEDFVNNQSVNTVDTLKWTGSVYDTKTTTIKRWSNNIRSYEYSKTHSEQPFKIEISNKNNSSEKYITINELISKKENYPISYYVNGGFVSLLGDPVVYPKWYNEVYTITSFIPQRQGYTFDKWNTKSDGSGTDYKSESPYNTYSDNAPLDLYAQWEAVIGTITYYKNCEYEVHNMPTSQQKEYDQILPLSNNIPVSANYVFVGWNTEENGSGISYQPGDILSKDIISLDLYAQWENTFNVTFEFGNNGSGGDNITNIPNINQWQYNTPMTFLNTNPIRYYIETSSAYYALYKLSRWYDKSTGITVTAENVMPGRDITITAEWQKADLLEAQNATAVRAEKNSQTEQYEPNDTGMDCILTVSFQRPKYYSYSRTINGDNETIGEGVLTSAPVAITGAVKSVINNIETIVYEINETDSSSNSSKDIGIHDSSSPPTYFDTDIFYNFSIDLDSRLDGDNSTELILNGNNLNLTEFLSRAAFAIDISADGERIGIFKPILDTGTQKQIELNGNLIIENEGVQNITLNRNGAIIADNVQVSTINSTTVNSITVNSTTINGVNNLNSGTAGTITIDNITATIIDTDELSVDTTLQADTINADNISASSLATDLLTVSSSSTQTTINSTGINTPNLTADNIGTYLHDEEEIIITAANINTSFAGPSIQLSPGTWFISGSVNFTTASGTTERNAQATLYSGSTQYAMTDMLRRTRIKSPDNGYMALPLSYILVNTQTLWITLAGSSDKLPGSATTNREGYLQAVRIK